MVTIVNVLFPTFSGHFSVVFELLSTLSFATESLIWPFAMLVT